MFTEKSLRDNAHLVKALMGIAAEDFYRMGEGIKKAFFLIALLPGLREQRGRGG